MAEEQKEEELLYRKIVSLSRRVWGPLFFLGLIKTILWASLPLFALALFSEQAQITDQTALLRYALLVGVLLALAFLLEAIMNQLLGRAAFRYEGLLAGALFVTRLQEMKDLLTSSERAGNPLDLLRQRRDFFLEWSPLTLLELWLVILLLALGLVIEPLLGVLPAGGFLILVLIILPLGEKTGSFLQTKAESRSRQNNACAKSVGLMVDTVSTMGLLFNLRDHWDKIRQREFMLHMDAVAAFNFVRLLTRLVSAIMGVGLLALGFLLYQAGQTGMGEILALTIITARMGATIDAYSRRMRGRIKEKTGRKSLSWAARFPLEGGQWQGKARGHILAENCEIILPGDLEPCFFIDKLELTPGQTALILGETASGKSLLCRALAGATGYHGSLKISDAEVKEWDKKLLGQMIGYMPQEMDLFAGSVGENIRRFNVQYKDDDVINAAEMAGVDKDIMALPRGYFYETGPADARLSTGIKQKIALARAIYQTPPLLILDAPTTHADKASLAHMAQLIEALKKRGTTIILASSTRHFFEMADILILVKNNKIITYGDKNTLLK